MKTVVPADHVGSFQRPAIEHELVAVDKALASDPDWLVVYGGDGTVAKVATALLELSSDVPLLPLHGGTANALATQLGVPRPLASNVCRMTPGEECL